VTLYSEADTIRPRTGDRLGERAILSQGVVKP